MGGGCSGDMLFRVDGLVGDVLWDIDWQADGDRNLPPKGVGLIVHVGWGVTPLHLTLYSDPIQST